MVALHAERQQRAAAVQPLVGRQVRQLQQRGHHVPQPQVVAQVLAGPPVPVVYLRGGRQDRVWVGRCGWVGGGGHACRDSGRQGYMKVRCGGVWHLVCEARGTVGRGRMA